MAEELKATHAALLEQVRGIMEALSQMNETEREELLTKAETIFSALEGMKV
jgi:hypothetical protein